MHPTDRDDEILEDMMDLLTDRGSFTVSSTNQPPNPALSRQGSGTTSSKPSSGLGPTAVKVGLKAVTQSTKVREKLKKSIEEKHGACFRTEIRDSGSFICGVHQLELWAEDLEECPTLKSILDLACAAVEEVVEEDELRREAAQKADAAARKAGGSTPRDEERKREAIRKAARDDLYRRARDRGIAGTPWTDPGRGYGR